MNIILTILTVFFLATFVKSFINCKKEKKIILIYRSFIGLVFIFSGFVKAVDPLGYTYKITDYFIAFGLESLNYFAFSLAIFFSTVEFIIGFMLLFNVKPKIGAVVVFIFMLGFTPLTLVLAITNPVSDCGCFGDALVITNWQTFWKNIIIFIPSLYLIINRRKLFSNITNFKQIIIVGIGVVAIIYVSVYCYSNLPIIDFRPYKIGNNISALKKEFYELSDKIPSEKLIIEATPESEREYIAESTYLYKKNGEVKEFTEIPDSTWEWKETKTNVISEGYKPPIHDFSIYNDTQGDITDIILNDTGYVYLLVSYKITESNFKGFVNATKLAQNCKLAGVKFICITASTDEDVNKLTDSLKNKFEFKLSEEITIATETIYYYEKDGEVQEFSENEQPDGNEWVLVGEEQVENEQIKESTDGLPFKFYSTDETTLKTVIRSNPGLVLLKNGTVVKKWHYNNFPANCNFLK